MNEFLLAYLCIMPAYYVFLIVILAIAFAKKKVLIDTDNPLRVAKFMGLMMGLALIWPLTSLYLVTSKFFDYINKYWITPNITPPATK